MKQVATPRTLMEAIRKFSNEDTAHAYVVQMRWPNGVACPHCGCKGPTFMERVKRWQCKDCRKQFSVKVGTIFEDSPIPLSKWLCAFWMVANCKNGVSTYEIMRDLGVTQKTAWFMNHRIRLAMEQGSFEKLAGKVEADETYVGGRQKVGKGMGRGTPGKTIVAGIVERGGRVRTKVVPNVRAKTVIPFIVDNVRADAVIYTDELTSYRPLTRHGYRHHTVMHMAGSYVEGDVHTNNIECYWNLLKRTIRGTYVSVDPWHLYRYCEEQSFRFNHRKNNDSGRLEHAMAGIVGRRLTYKALIQSPAWG